MLRRNLAEESSLSAVMGSWVSTAIMIPFAFFLTRRASKGMGLFNIDVFLQIFTRPFQKQREKGKGNTQSKSK